MTIIPEVWTLIVAMVGVVVGAIFGFGLTLLRDYIQEKRQRKRYLEDLLEELEYNKKLAKKGIVGGSFPTSAYADVKRAKYLFDLSNQSRINIYKAYNIISDINRYGEGALEDLEELKELLENIIPELERLFKK